MPAERRNRTGGELNDPPPVGSYLSRAPGFVGEVEIDLAVVLGDADVDSTLWGVKLGARLK
jgi:hypothetical protein